MIGLNHFQMIYNNLLQICLEDCNAAIAHAQLLFGTERISLAISKSSGTHEPLIAEIVV